MGGIGGYGREEEMDYIGGVHLGFFVDAECVPIAFFAEFFYHIIITFKKNTLFINMFSYFPNIEWFFLSLITYFAGYKLTHLLYKNNPYYCQLSDDRKNYFQKNIVKTLALVGISGMGSIVLYKGFVGGEWDNEIMYKLGYMYSALDVLGLMVVKNLPMNSRIHHVSSFLFSYMNTLVDYGEPTFWVGLPIYCVLSCYAFGVNYFLAQRLITPLKSLRGLIRYNIISYCLLLMINWAYQVYNIYDRVGWNFTWDVYLFVGLVMFVANDDVKLVRFMVHHYRKSVIEEGSYP